MNKTDEKSAVEAGKLFREEVLEIMPDITLEELANMVGEYVYYQQREVSRTDLGAVVRQAC